MRLRDREYGRRQETTVGSRDSRDGARSEGGRRTAPPQGARNQRRETREAGSATASGKRAHCCTEVSCCVGRRSAERGRDACDGASAKGRRRRRACDTCKRTSGEASTQTRRREGGSETGGGKAGAKNRAGRSRHEQHFGGCASRRQTRSGAEGAIAGGSQREAAAPAKAKVAVPPMPPKPAYAQPKPAKAPNDRRAARVHADCLGFRFRDRQHRAGADDGVVDAGHRAVHVSEHPDRAAEQIQSRLSRRTSRRGRWRRSSWRSSACGS